MFRRVMAAFAVLIGELPDDELVRLRKEHAEMARELEAARLIDAAREHKVRLILSAMARRERTS